MWVKGAHIRRAQKKKHPHQIDDSMVQLKSIRHTDSPVFHCGNN